MSDRDADLALEWLGNTPYLSLHAGVPSNLPMIIATPETILSLAALLRRVREEERERCAVTCDSLISDSDGSAFDDGVSLGRERCAAAIRAGRES